MSDVLSQSYLAYSASSTHAISKKCTRSWYGAMTEAWGEALDMQSGHIEGLATSLQDVKDESSSKINELTAESLRVFTAKSQEFMFHSHLTTKVANHTADGLPQLFRQQI